MILSESTTSTGLIEDARWWSETNTTSYPSVDVKRSINKWYQELFADVLLSMDEWDVGGEIATASLVANQQEYTWPSDLLRIKRMEVTYDGTTWTRVYPFDIQETSESIATQANINTAFVASAPRYDAHDNSIFLFPVPTATSTNGLKIWYEKEITELSSDSDEPNIAEPFQRLLSIGAAYDYALRKGLPISANLLQKLELGRAKLREYYTVRVTDRNFNFGANISDYS